MQNVQLKQNIHSLQRALELQKHEMTKLKRVASNVLTQRSEVESYLINALNTAKEVVSESGSKFEISDLSWAEREDILRILFAQLNENKTKLPKIKKVTV